MSEQTLEHCIVRITAPRSKLSSRRASLGATAIRGVIAVLLTTLPCLPMPTARGEEPSSVFHSTPPKQHEVKVTSSRHEYDLFMDGTVDADNTTTRRHGTFQVAFQPNLSLSVENTGETPVVNPRVLVNGKRRWWSMEDLLREILAGAESDQEKALLIWDFVRKNRHHDDPIFGDDELHDPVKLLSVFGGGLCDDAGAVGCSLFYHAGFQKEKHGRNPKTRHLHGHVMCEVFLDGAYQFLDIDEDAFYLDRENERPVGGDILARDHDLVKREHAYGPVFQGWQVGENAAALFGGDDGAGFRAVAGHRIDMTLRPGEKIVYRWDNVGKFASDGPKGRRFWGNSLHVYSPRLDADTYRLGLSAEGDIRPAVSDSNESRLAGTSGEAYLVYEMSSPYAVCGGRVNARFVGKHAEDRFEIALSLDNKNWKTVWSQSGNGPIRCGADLDQQLEVKKGPPKYRYWVRVALGSASPGSAQLAELSIETDLMASPHALPRLSLGQNRVVYTDDTPEPHEITVTHRWRESSNVVPPQPPAQPLLPKTGAVVQTSTFSFRWPAVSDAARYHIQVSRTPDMKLCYRPCFDVTVEGTSHGSPFTGLFSPDVDYYWRVRPQNDHGVWGAWSPVWHCRWDGPRVPIDLKYDVRQNGEIVVTWEPNPRGPRPVAYEIYGSDERGFSISKTAYQVRGLGRQPANLLARTTATSFVVVTPDASHPNRNRSFYRVVAIDRKGTESGGSDYVELPHPHIVSRPVTEAAVAQPYVYQVKSLRSLGDLQHRYSTPNQKFWEREGYEYELLQGPAWLKLDRKEGRLSGTPAPSDVGTSDVRIRVKRLFPHEVKPTEKSGPVFQKTASRFEASHQQHFRMNVQP